MPFTPFHMGPALALKAVAGRRFSLTVFGFSQVAMDLEPLVRMLRGDAILHGFTHTYLGATLVGLFSVLAGRPVCERLLRWWKPDPGAPLLAWMAVQDTGIPWSAAAAGAFVGTYSHVALDSVMHDDMRPFAPLSAANGLLLAIPVDSLHVLCVATGLAGLLLMIAFARMRGVRHGEHRG